MSAASISNSDGINVGKSGIRTATKGESTGRITVVGETAKAGSKGVGSRKKIVLLRLKVAIHKFLFPSYHLARGNRILVRSLKAD